MSTPYPPSGEPAPREHSEQETPADEPSQQDQQDGQPYSAVQEGSGDDGGQPGHIPLPSFGEQPPAYGQQQPPAYGQQQLPAYGQQPPAYGQQAPAYGETPWGGVPQAQPWDNSAYGSAQAGALPKEAYASWGQRVGAYLIDYGVFLVAYIIASIILGIGLANSSASLDPATSTAADVDPLALVGYLLLFVIGIAQLAFSIWNRWIRAGRTGMSLGKQRMGIKLVGSETGMPIGGGKAFLRDLVRGLLGYVPLVPIIDLLFPLWDDRRQTLTDKIMSTVVVKNQ